MRMIEVEAGQRRDDCVAMMCAEVYGHDAGLAPLITYAAAVGALLPNLAARVVALAEGERLRSVAMLVLEEQGKGLALALLATPRPLRGRGHGRELVERLAASAAMRVTVDEPRREAFFATFGFTRWFDDPAAKGRRVGVNARSQAGSLDQLDSLVEIDEAAIIRTFKNDPVRFDRYKHDFVDGLARFPDYC